MQTSATGEVVIIPRNFKLLEELEHVSKGNTNADISYGLRDPEDTFLIHWTGMLMGPANTPFDNRFYSLEITCTDDYPSVPPQVRFKTKVNLPSCNQRDGKIIENKLSCMKNWNRQMGIHDVLEGIKREMLLPANRRLVQPAEGEEFL